MSLPPGQHALWPTPLGVFQWADATALNPLLARIPGAREQDQALEVLQETLGEGWVDRVIHHVPHAPAGLINRLLSVGRLPYHLEIGLRAQHHRQAIAHDRMIVHDQNSDRRHTSPNGSSTTTRVPRPGADVSRK